MRKGITTITSEIILTIITVSLIIPLLAYINSLEIGNNIENTLLSPLTCITYKYIDANKILLYNDCNYNIKVYSFDKTKISYSILYYNDTTESFRKTTVIYAKGLHLLTTSIPVSKILLNTSHGILVLNRK